MSQHCVKLVDWDAYLGLKSLEDLKQSGLQTFDLNRFFVHFGLALAFQIFDLSRVFAGFGLAVALQIFNLEGMLAL